MTDTISTYFAILIITIVGALATMIIVRTVHSSTLIVVAGGTAATYEVQLN